MRRWFGVYATVFISFGAVLGALLVTAPAAHAGTYYQIVDNANSNRFQASGRWIGSHWSSQKYGKNYRVLKRPLSVVQMPPSSRFELPLKVPTGFSRAGPPIPATTTRRVSG